MTIKQLKDRIYNDLISSFENAITPLKKSLFEQLSNTLAAVFQLLYIYLDRIINDSFLTTCTVKRVLNYFAPLKNIDPKLATVSKGVIRFIGTETTSVPSGTSLTYSDLEYVTIEDGTVVNGFVDVNSESVGKGTLNNTLANIQLIISVPIIGIDNEAMSIFGFSGAVDDEIPESVRTRTKQKFAMTTEVDNDNFYKSLANELANVKATFISDIKNGPGTFGVTILTFSNNGVPAEADIDEVEQYFIDNEAVPVYVDAQYFLPTIIYQDFTIQLVINDATNQAIVEAAMRDYMYLTQKPGTNFNYAPLADFLQTFGARLISPEPAFIVAILNDEILDVGDIVWQ